MFCPNCGNEIQDGTKFCGKCGNLVTFANAKNDTTGNAGNMNGQVTKKQFLMLGVAGALVVVIALTIMVVNFNKVRVKKTNINDENVTETNINVEKVAELNYDIKVGDLTEFGTYEQDGNLSNGKEAIEWQVLAKESGKALLISKYALEQKPYNTELTGITWENCSLRKWLNNDFYKNAFTSSEKNKIVETYVMECRNSKYNTNPGNSTHDNVFLLSINEANRYFTSDESRNCTPTIHLNNNDIYTGNNGCCAWWLRSPGNSDIRAATVYSEGVVGYEGGGVNFDDRAVRPALWVNL